MRRIKWLLMASFACCFFFAEGTFAQVKDTITKTTDTSRRQVSGSAQQVNPPKELSRQDSMKAKYVNPGKVAGRKAVYRSMIIPGWGQLYNIQLLNDGYGPRAGKSQFWQKLYTGGKIAAIYGGVTVLTLSYIDATQQYKRYLTELQYRSSHNDQPDPAGPFVNADGRTSRYSTAGITTGKDTYRRNRQIILFSYGLVYAANVIDAYVAARLHFFNIDDNLSFKVMPTMIQSNTLYGFNSAPAVRLSLTF